MTKPPPRHFIYTINNFDYPGTSITITPVENSAMIKIKDDTKITLMTCIPYPFTFKSKEL